MKQIADSITGILSEIRDDFDRAKVDKFPSLRHVDAKAREFKLLINQLPTEADSLKESFQNDKDFEMNSRRVRLEALANYCQTALNFINKGIVKSKKQIFKSPDLENLADSIPGLKDIIENRWLEAQKCMHIGAYLSSVILMGSILEALLLGRASLNQGEACKSAKAPKRKDGKTLQVHEWNLNSLIDVSVDLGWIKVDRGKFSHSLRESRNVVHPWQHATLKADFDENTCKTCWVVLTSAVDDLLGNS